MGNDSKAGKADNGASTSPDILIRQTALLIQDIESLTERVNALEEKLSNRKSAKEFDFEVVKKGLTGFEGSKAFNAFKDAIFYISKHI